MNRAAASGLSIAPLRGEREAVTLRVRRGSDEPHEVVVANRFAAPPVPAHRAAAPNWELRWLDDGVAVLRIASFAVDDWQAWLEAAHEEREAFLREFRARIDERIAELHDRGARALVIDLRGNPGGTDSLGIHLAERLLEGPFRYFLLSARGDDGRWRRPGGLEYGAGDHPRYLGPLALLVDERTFSTADNFARCMTDLHPHCTVVGRPTGAGTGAPRVFVTTPTTRASIGGCTMRVYGPAGDPTEGRGTRPDVPILWCAADFEAGRDPDLAAALRALGSR